jgi:Na+-transporting methylmalonyl-CoA/oxaloacetate decarboxylase gamma subunit
MDNFGLSLQVTALGMGLVILTMVIVAAIIMLLDRIFRPKPESEEKKSDSLTDELIVESLIPESTPVTASLNDEAAAIALAIALHRGRRRSPSLMPKAVYEEPEVTGEVVSVVSIAPGASIWAGTGRLQPQK